MFRTLIRQEGDMVLSGSHFHSESSGEGGAAPSTLGDLLREARRRRGMTLAQVAEVVGCARSYLSELESGKRPPPSDEIVGALERALGVQPGTFADAAAWGRTPGRVKHTVWRLSQQAERASRAREELMARLSKMKGLDAALKSGELRELIEQLSPGEERMQMVSTRDVPLINKVAAGYPREFTDLGYPARVADEYVRCPEVTDADAFAARVVGDSMMPEYREGDVVVFSPMRDVKDGNDCFVRLERDAETTFKRVYFEEEGRLRLQPLNAKYPARILEREEIGGLYVAVSVIRKVGG